jgi:cell division protease FtsH
LESQLAVALLGGPLAKEIIYGEDMITTGGTSNNIQQVAIISSSMVKEWGMSDKILGCVALSEPSGGGPWMGLRMLQRQTVWVNKILGMIEEEVEHLINNSCLVAKQILTKNRDWLEHLSKTLMDQEVVSAEEFQMMLIQFKAKTIAFKVLGGVSNCEKLTFQTLPISM